MRVCCEHIKLTRKAPTHLSKKQAAVQVLRAHQQVAAWTGPPSIICRTGECFRFQEVSAATGCDLAISCSRRSVGIARWICETKTNQNDDSGCPKPPTAASSPRTPNRNPARCEQEVSGRREEMRGSLRREYKHHRFHLFPVTGQSLNPELPGRP